MADTNVELLLENPDALAERISGQLGLIEPRRVELTYGPQSPHSYYRDLILHERGRGTVEGEQRLHRHAEEMDKVLAERRRESERVMRSGMFEFRVEPDRTQGTGGYFAPPAWLNQLFATANRPERVLADLMPTFPLPEGVSSVNLPVIATGTSDQIGTDDASVSDTDFTDTQATSTVATLEGQADVSLQLLELSPPGAHLDWALFADLSEAYDAQLELQLLNGADAGTGQLLGVLNVNTGGSTQLITYTDATPSVKAMIETTAGTQGGPLPQAIAAIGNNRKRKPECWLMSTSRAAWITSGEIALPLALSNQTGPGAFDLLAYPVYEDDAMPTNLGAGSNQDRIVALRPSDMILLEGDPVTMVAREPLSASMGVRIQMHQRAAAFTGRRSTSIAVVQGSGLIVPAGF